VICGEVPGLKGALPEDLADLRRGIEAVFDRKGDDHV